MSPVKSKWNLRICFVFKAPDWLQLDRSANQRHRNAFSPKHVLDSTLIWLGSSSFFHFFYLLHFLNLTGSVIGASSENYKKKQRKTNPKNKTKQTNKQNRPTKKNRSFNSTRRDPNSVHTGQLSRHFRRRAYGRQIRDRAGNGDRWLRRGQPPSTKDRQHPLLFEEKETHTHTQSERERERESEIRPRSMGRSTPGKRLQLVSPLTSPILLTWTRLRRNTRATFRF